MEIHSRIVHHKSESIYMYRCPNCGYRETHRYSRPSVEEYRYKFYSEDFRSYIKKLLFEIYWKQGLSQRQIAEKLGVRQQLISAWMKKLDISTRTKYKLVEVKVTPSPELSYVLGVLKGDGYIINDTKQGHYSVVLETVSLEFAESFKYALQKLGFNPCLRLRKSLNSPISKKLLWHVEAHSKLFINWYTGLNNVELSTIARMFPADFVRGFYESEGTYHYGIDNRWKRLRGWIIPTKRIQITNKTKELIMLVKKLLDSLGIPSSIYYVRQLGMYRLQISRQKAVDDFLNIVRPCIKNGRN
jgi:intein-encoded DNA endonuclease-like protein